MSESDGARLPILLAEDEATLRTVISEVLEEDGYSVTDVGSGEEALRRFNREPFPIVITDIVLGRMTGLELLAQIKDKSPETVVVIMTSHASIETATAALRSGAYDFLIKPFEDLDVLSTVVGRAAEKVKLLEDNRRLMEDLKKKASEMEALNKKLREMAERDGLTGLYNHRYFWKVLDLELERSRRHERSFSLVYIDVDNFKNYNDTLGHLAGDDLLKTLATIMTERCRASTIAARTGGEEFVLLVPETDKEGALSLAEDIRRIVEQHPFEGRESQPLGTVSISAGVSTYPADGEDPTSLIGAADKALYQAKNAGRNTVR